MSRRIEYQPALDGVRAIAVIMVLLFHGGAPWAGGGYIGVSVFFTLSGFLITTLLHRELVETGRVAVGPFLARRARRLVPAAALCLAGVLVCASAGLLEGVANLRRDVLAATLQVQNWVLLLSGETYTDVLARTGGRPSPVEHFWSLAVEEQFYWIWPLAFVAVAALGRRRLPWSVAVLAAAFALVAPVVAIGWGSDAAYWATPARLGEILLGAWLAVSAANRSLDHRWALAAPTALVALVAAAIVLPAGQGLAYEGGLPLVAVASTALIAGLQVPSPARRALAWRPLVAVGRISYGIYLFHWPVFVILDEPRTGVDGPALLGIRLSVTALVAVASWFVVERPIRAMRWAPLPTLASALALTCTVLVATTALPSHDEPYWRAEAVGVERLAPVAEPVPLRPAPPRQQRAVLRSRDGPERAPVVPAAESVARDVPSGPEAPAVAGAVPAPPTSAPPTSVVPARPARVVVVGDSTAEALGAGLVAWADRNTELAEVALAVSPGCGFLRGGTVPSDGDAPFGEGCDRILDVEFPRVLDQFHPDLVVLLTTARDLMPRQWSEDEGVLDPSDPRFVERLARDYAAITASIADAGSTAVWVRAPTADPYWRGVDSPFADSPHRDVVDSVMATVVSNNAARAELVDFRAWLEHDPIGGDHAARPDGIHWSLDGALDVATRWLGPELVRVALEHA